MSFTPDTECSWIKVCTGKINDSWYSGFNGTIHHHIDNDYSIDVCGVSIPAIRTKREFSCNYVHDVTARNPKGDKLNGKTGMIVSCVDANPRDHFTQSITEDCVIEKSVLAYVDHRRGVVLYRYEKQWVKFSKSSTDECWWRTDYDSVGTGKITLLKGDFDAGVTVEWRLAINSTVTVLYTETDTSFNPFGECFSVLRSDGIMTNPDIVQIFSLPQPPSKSTAYDLDLKALEGYQNGLYDYGNKPGEESELNKLDGGNKDMFYPRWCRGLHSDPIWRDIADNRYAISWFKEEAVQNKVWYPPPVSSDPLPLGNHVYHPKEGDVWQWLLPTPTGGNVMKTNMDFVNDLLIKAGVELNGTNLYYPIGVV